MFFCLCQSNAITCTCSSYDHRWVVTADIGPNSMVIVWDSHTGYVCFPRAFLDTFYAVIITILSAISTVACHVCGDWMCITCSRLRMLSVSCRNWMLYALRMHWFRTRMLIHFLTDLTVGGHMLLAYHCTCTPKYFPCKTSADASWHVVTSEFQLVKHK